MAPKRMTACNLSTPEGHHTPPKLPRLKSHHAFHTISFSKRCFHLTPGIVSMQGANRNRLPPDPGQPHAGVTTW